MRKRSVLGWRLHKNGWTVSVGNLYLIWNVQSNYRELRLEWIVFKDRLWAGWSKTIWFGRSELIDA